MRRTTDKHRSFLPVREDFHPKRNEARQKLASLESPKFRNLSSDIYFELRRRYPLIDRSSKTRPNNNGKSSQPIHIVPVKGMMSVESIGYSDEEQSPQKATRTENLDSLMADLGNMVKPSKSDNPLQKRNTIEDNVRKEYEKKIESMSQQISSLQLSLQNSSTINQRDSSVLQNQYQKLLNEHSEQQTAVQEVKSEIRNLIVELKNLSEKNETLRVQKEQADAAIQSLTEESKSWKTKYESIHAELRNYKVKSMQFDPNDLSRLLKPTTTGAIGHQFIIEYQTAIDELMRTSRSAKPSDVLATMRSIVMSCKSITTEVEEYEIKTGLSEADQASLYELKKRFSTGLSSLLSAATSFANGMGISPVSLVDAAAVTLTATIVDLVKLLGMRSVTSDSKLHAKRGSHVLSPNQLSQFLKRETEHIAGFVQNLLGALRTNDGSLFNIITCIIQLVSNIITVSKKTYSTSEGSRYREDGQHVLDGLERCNNRILSLRDTSFSSQEPANSMAKRSLSHESCQIAKYIKELISMLDM
ncbi:unnamed protein product [Rhizopus stolonifer]